MPGIIKCISYVMCTKNRGAIFLSTLQDLIASKRPQDEIVIVDGGDDLEIQRVLHTKRATGEIDTLIEGPDKNQAHGWNRGFLACQGEFIKKITDDDVFDYSAIRVCAEYLESHVEYDLVISNELFTDMTRIPSYDFHSFESGLLGWRRGTTRSFFFSDPHILIRASSLPWLGLFSTSVALIDYEWSLRVTALGAKIAYFTGANSMTVWHKATVTGQMSEREYYDEYSRLDRFYRNTANPFRPWRRRLIKARLWLSRIGGIKNEIEAEGSNRKIAPSHLEEMRGVLANHNQTTSLTFF